MLCEHKNGGLQLFTYEQGVWHTRCLCCGDVCTADVPEYPAEAGSAAATGFIRYAQRRFGEAAALFQQAASLSGDARYAFAALMCRYGVTWCGNELQPTFGAYPLPAGSMQASPEWQAVEAAAGSLGSAVYMSLNSRLQQLEDIVGCIRRQEGVSACDVFLCYRRTSANVQSALRLYQELTASGLRVFCADVTTRGKTQEQFEAEVYHALHTAEYLVLLPGEDGLTPWLQNELDRAACDPSHRLILSTAACTEKLGEHLPLNEIRARLLTAAADCQPGKLYSRALEALRANDVPRAAALMQRASAKGDHTAQLLCAELCREGLVFPADPDRAGTYLRLAGEPSESCRRQVSDDLMALEEALGLTRRQALIYLVADVSDAGFMASQLLARTFISALHADRHLARSEMCLIGYDRHARVLAEPKALTKYGLAADAAAALHTSSMDGSDRSAYAAKGLRCAADHLQHYAGAQGREPFVVLLRPCPTNDHEASLEAAWMILEGLIRPEATATLPGADQTGDCILRLQALVQ